MPAGGAIFMSPGLEVVEAVFLVGSKGGNIGEDRFRLL